MAEPSVEPHLFVILGATGDLTKRKLLPALFHLRSRGEPDKHTTVILGAAQPEMSDEARSASLVRRLSPLSNGRAGDGRRL